MRKAYVGMEADILFLDFQDVLTASAEFTDPNTGDNGTYFPTAGKED